MVDNNQASDRLAGQALMTTNLCLEVLTVHGTELHLFWAKAYPLLIILMSRI